MNFCSMLTVKLAGHCRYFGVFHTPSKSLVFLYTGERKQKIQRVRNDDLDAMIMTEICWPLIFKAFHPITSQQSVFSSVFCPLDFVRSFIYSTQGVIISQSLCVLM